MNTLPEWAKRVLRPARDLVYHVALVFFVTPFQRFISGPCKRATSKNKQERFLEIGPGLSRIPDFETLNVVGGMNVDYVCDASKHLPFDAETFDIIYGSHILEHIPWYQTGDVLKEWVRILKTGGVLEVWVPDGLKIAESFVAAEREGASDFNKDGWWRYNEHHDPCVWMNGRTFSYGDGTGRPGHPNWHRGLFSERYMRKLFSDAGLMELRVLKRAEVRGHDHGWINMGLSGTKR